MKTVTLFRKCSCYVSVNPFPLTSLMGLSTTCPWGTAKSCIGRVFLLVTFSSIIPSHLLESIQR